MADVTKEDLTPFLFEDIKSSERPEVILANAPKFKELMMQYECAIMEVNTKLCVKNGVCTSSVITWRNYGFL